MKHIDRQRGITLSGMIMGCIVLGAVALTVMKLWPVYNEKFKVDMSMDKLAALPEGARMSKLDLAKELQRQFDVQDIDTIEYKNLPRVLQLDNVRGSSNKLLTLKYEIRAPFFSDLDVVLKYNKAVELGSGGTD